MVISWCSVYSLQLSLCDRLNAMILTLTLLTFRVRTLSFLLPLLTVCIYLNVFGLQESLVIWLLSTLTANFLQQVYHTLRKAFFKVLSSTLRFGFLIRYRTKTLLLQGLSEPEFRGAYVYMIGGILVKPISFLSIK